MMPEQQEERTERWGIWWLASYEERRVRIMELKYSHVHVRLLGQDGNPAFRRKRLKTFCRKPSLGITITCCKP
jgi:hypothetical protein